MSTTSLARSRPFALATAFYIAATVFITWPQALHLDSAVPGDRDALLSIWRLTWIAHQLPRDPAHLFDANIFYPEPRTLGYSDAALLPSVLVAPLLWAGVSRVLVYNLLLLGSMTLSGVGTFVLVRSIAGRFGASLFAGVVFAFSPYRFEHYHHLELQAAWWMPLGLWALHRSVASGRWRYALGIGGVVAAQCLSSLYYGVFFATSVLVVGGVLFLVSGGGALKRAAPALVAGAVLCAAVVLPYAWPYLDNRRTVGDRPEEEIASYSATPINYLAAPAGNVLYGWTADTWGSNERRLFPGFVVFVFAVVGLIWSPAPARYAYGAALLVAFDASLGLNGHIYPWLHEHVLPYRGFRVPARFAIVVNLMLSVLGGLGVASLAHRVSKRWQAAGIGTAAIVVALVEFRTVLPPLEALALKPTPLAYILAASPGAVSLHFPLAVPERLDLTSDHLYMYESTFYWHKLANGYSGFFPSSYIELIDRMRTFPSGSTIDYLRDRGIEYFVLHAKLYDDQTYRRLLYTLDQRLDIAPIARDLDWSVYRVIR